MNRERARALVAKFDFATLFIEELGWNRHRSQLEFPIGDHVVAVEGIAEKGGMVAFTVRMPPDASAETRKRIEHQVAKSVHEHLIVFLDENRTVQVWQWVRRGSGQSMAVREHPYYVGQSGESLIQKLDALAWSLEESERGVTILDVTRRAQGAFDVDRVTKSFYDRFKVEHDQFKDFIAGIRNTVAREWYASVMLNRLMFIYFIQKKGFLDNDPDYLRNKLQQIQTRKGPDKFLSFYRHFLLRLFHEGLAKQKRTKDLDDLVGDVPYLNGGLFDVHELEKAHTDIAIADDAFEKLFDFFDSYQWHLDDRPLHSDDEINPEVLGYIFEQFVNQKQMGAYYTKEDVTGFMAASAILPVVLDRLESVIGGFIQVRLQRAPERYVPAPMAHGRRVMLADTKLDGAGDSSIALPGESLREVQDRRRAYDDLVAELRAGRVASATEASTRNLDLRLLAADALAELEEPEHVAAAFRLLKELAILDPTCGSGAFLFAALYLLRDLYSLVVDRAQELVGGGRDTAAGDLAALLSDIRKHASQEYFVLKTIVLSNLYGLDILEEATAIARLRLFLALVAKLRSREEIEPLPDLDLNIRTGNLLVGVRSVDDAAELFSTGLFASAGIPKVLARASEAADLYAQFVDAQRDGTNGELWDGLKTRLEKVEQALREEIDALYAAQLSPGAKVAAWRESHKPFHWFIEFPQVMERGGFDIVIGNPPYVQATKLVGYRYSGFETDDCPDIFAPCVERAADLVRPDGSFAMILPIAFQFSDDYDIARKVVAERLPLRAVSTYSRNPSALFSAGLGVRSTIVIARSGEASRCLTTDTRRWVEDFRPYLFATNRYSEITSQGSTDPWPRLGHPTLVDLYDGLVSNNDRLGASVSKVGHPLGFKQTALYYVSVFIDEPPAWSTKGKRVEQTQVGELHFSSLEERDVAFVLLAGRIAVWWWAQQVTTST
jgi:Eco57I restriction-modification methylase